MEVVFNTYRYSDKKPPNDKWKVILFFAVVITVVAVLAWSVLKNLE